MASKNETTQGQEMILELIKRFEVSDARRDEQQKNIVKSINDLMELIKTSYITKNEVTIEIGKAKEEITKDTHALIDALSLDYQKNESLNSLARKMIFSVVGIGGATLIGAIISSVMK